MSGVQRVVFALSILLLAISLAGSYFIIQNVNLHAADQAPVQGLSNAQQGEVKLNILPTAKGSSATGYIGVKILPSSGTGNGQNK